jgi:hypothetical protein
LEADSNRAYHLPHAKVPIQICLKQIIDLRPHEETVEAELQAMIRKMRQETVLRHPIIADVTTGTVLDGTHRLAALSALGCEYVPAALIDYQSLLINLSKWFRIISGEKLETFIERIKKYHPLKVDAPALENSLINRSSFAAVYDGNKGYVFANWEENPIDIARKAFEIELVARNSGLTISYSDTGEIEQIVPEQFVLSGILVTKAEVVEATKKQQHFPPKTTRHLIPSRPLATRTPLKWLQERGHAEAETLFLKQLQSKKVRRLPEGSWVGSRRYQEEVFLFE